MKIYINNEEVLCNSKLSIKEPLKNSKSVILNNVYPKTWESDKDYVSRFYMPKDYSQCEIYDNENTEEREEAWWVYQIGGAYTDDTTQTIQYLSGMGYQYLPTIPGEKFKIICNSTRAINIYEADDLWENTPLTKVGELQIGSNEVTITPEKNFIIYNYKYDNTEVISNVNAKRISKSRLYEVTNNKGTIQNKVLSYSDSKIYYNTNYSINYIKVIPGKNYIIKMHRTSNNYICESDSLNIGTIASRLFYVGVTNTIISIKPTKKYLVFHTTLDIDNIYINADDTLLFAGYVKNSGNINLNPRYPHYSTLQALDYESLLSEGDTLNFVLEEQTIENALKRVVNELDGFALSKIELEKEQTIAAYNCNDKTPFDVFDYIAEITGSIWYAKTIDKKLTIINFYSTDNLVASTQIDYTEEYFRDNEILDIKYSYNTQDYRNKQGIISTNVNSGITQKENITYNGTTMETTYPISKIVSIKSGTKEYSVATNIAKESGIYANFYYTYGRTSIEPYGKISTGQVLTIEYYSLINSRQVAFNQTEADRISGQTNRNGIISRYEKRTDTANEVELSQIAQTYLDYKGVPEISINVKSTKDLYKVGDRVFFNAPLEDLKTNYLVTDREIDMIVSGEQQVIFYTYKLSSSFNDENAINYFNNQRRKQQGTIKEGEYIQRYIDLPSTTNIIFYDMSYVELTAPNDILDGELDIELIGEPTSSNKLNAKLNFKL